MIGNEQKVRERIAGLVNESGLRKSVFAQRVGIDPSNFNKKLDGAIKFTDADIKKISATINIRWEWITTGEGEKDTNAVPRKNDVVEPEIPDSHKQMFNYAMKLASKENECKMLHDMYEKAVAEREKIIKDIIKLSNEREYKEKGY